MVVHFVVVLELDIVIYLLSLTEIVVIRLQQMDE